jgi:hypothetical protein
VNEHDLIWEPIKALYGAAAVGIVSLVARWLSTRYTRSAAAGRLRVVIPAGTAGLLLFVHWRLGWPRPELFALLAVVIVLGFSVWELVSFWRTGLQGADPSVAKGLDYAKSLALCRNELWFLGIGAAKLSEQQNFEAALRRCSRVETGEVRVRFLLARPNSEFLRQAALQAGEAPDRYEHLVEDSLRRLARVLTDRAVKLQVRFYPDRVFVPLFRLMFIDDRLCLASYNVFGHGDGSELPQIRVARNDDRDYASFYYPFRRYFEALWEDAEPWNPEEYLGK